MTVERHLSRIAPPHLAALSPIVGAVVMAATAPLLDRPVLGFVGAGVIACGALPMALVAWWANHVTGVRHLYALIVLTVVAVTDLIHFTVRVSSWFADQAAFTHPATIVPCLVVLAALTRMWQRTRVSQLLAVRSD